MGRINPPSPPTVMFRATFKDAFQKPHLVTLIATIFQRGEIQHRTKERITSDLQMLTDCFIHHLEYKDHKIIWQYQLK